jgi:hypothetical protein
MLAIFRLIYTAGYIWLAATRLIELRGSTILWGSWVLIELTVTGVVLAILWAPVIGERMSDPLTAQFTEDTGVVPSNRLTRWILACHAKRNHRAALALCLLEGLRKPHALHPLLLGIQSVKPGSRLERMFALEIYQHNHVAHCIRARDILLSRHHVRVPPHPDVGVERILRCLETKPQSPTQTVPLIPGVPPPIVQRNPNIQLFEPGASAAYAPPNPNPQPGRD